jgi:hypothetical protein
MTEGGELFRDSEQIMLDKAKEQAKFEKLVEKEKITCKY